MWYTSKTYMCKILNHGIENLILSDHQGSKTLYTKQLDSAYKVELILHTNPYSHWKHDILINI